MEQIVTEFEAGNVPKFDDGFYHAIIHPFSKYDIMHDPRWRDPHKYVDTQNLYAGELGEIAGVRFMQSSEAKIFRGDDLASDSRTLTINLRAIGGKRHRNWSGRPDNTINPCSHVFDFAQTDYGLDHSFCLVAHLCSFFC